jgi:cellulose synthase operon protein YhjQ
MNQVNVLAIVSAKGGVGKTTLTANLAAALAKDRRILCMDLDPQNALRLHLGVAMDEFDGVARCTLEGRRWDSTIFQSPNTPEVLPFGTINEADRDAFEVYLAEHPEWLERGIATLGLKPNDWIVLDTPPGPSLYLQQALRVAKFALVLLHPDAASFSTIPSMEALIQRYCRDRRDFNGSAYLLNNVNSNSSLSRDVTAVLRSSLGARLTPMVIHQDEAVREALASDQLLAEYDPHCEAAHDVAACAKWVASKMLLSAGAMARK